MAKYKRNISLAIYKNTTISRSPSSVGKRKTIRIYIFRNAVVIFGQFLIHLGMTEDLVILSYLFVMKTKSN
jgi:hypothetical protein